MTAALFFDDVTLGYDSHPVVHHLRGEVGKGELVAVTGPNGAGKSTLLKAIRGVMRPLAGRIECAMTAAHDIAYLPQAADIDRSFPLTVRDLVSAGAWHRCGLFAAISGKITARVNQAIADVGLKGFEERAIGALSGGQLQRALFARVLVQDASIILLDEPFTAIDSRTTADLLALIARWREEKRTVVTVLHDLEMIRAHFPRTLLLARSAIAWGATAKVLTTENLTAARHMIEAPDPHAPFCAAE